MPTALLLALVFAVCAPIGDSTDAPSPAPERSTPDATAPETTPPDLSGPTVNPEAMKPGLAGGMTSDGLAALGAEPDVTLIGRLDLSDSQRAQYEQLLAERWGQFDAIVRDNADLLQRMQTEIRRQRASDNPRPTNREALRLIRAVREAFQPFFERGSFFDEFRPHLSAGQIEDVERTLAEVRGARRDGMAPSDRRSPRPRGEGRDAMENSESASETGKPNEQRRAARRRAPGGQGLAPLLQESLQRQAAFARESFAQFVDDLDLTDTQRQLALDIFRPITAARLSGERVDPTIRARAFIELMGILTPQQRQALQRMGRAEVLRTGPETDPPDSGGER